MINQRKKTFALDNPASFIIRYNRSLQRINLQGFLQPRYNTCVYGFFGTCSDGRRMETEGPLPACISHVDTRCLSGTQTNSPSLEGKNFRRWRGWRKRGAVALESPHLLYEVVYEKLLEICLCFSHGWELYFCWIDNSYCRKSRGHQSLFPGFGKFG